LPESEFEFVVRRPELQYIDSDAFLFLAEGVEDGDLLFAPEGKASGTTVYD